VITLKQIAELANVSVSTVSRVLNGKGNISEKTKERVRKIMAELNYQPGSVMRAHVANNSYTIGVFVPASNNFINDDPSTSIDINTLKDELESMGSKILLATNNGLLSHNTSAYELISKKKIDGAVVCDPYVNDEYIPELIKRDIPYIITNGRFLDRDYNYIDYNHLDGAFQAVDYLLSLGHRKIAVLAGPEDSMVTMNRIEGCKAAFKKYNIPFSDVTVQYGPFSINSGYMRARQLLQESREITAIFGFNDLIAVGAMRAVKEKGLAVPDDISIIGFDNGTVALCVEPPLTSVRRFNFDISGLIARGINDLISNRNIERIQISLKTELIIRDSCKAIK